MPKVSELVWLWVKQRPYIQAGLERRVVNYSALAREINKHLKESEPAVKMALVRISKRLKKERKGSEEKLLSVIRGSSLELKARVAVVISRIKVTEGAVASAKGSGYYLSIVEESNLNKIRKKGVLQIQCDLDMINVKSPKSIEKVPGVVAFLLSQIAAENINVVHIFSFHSDNFLITQSGDTAKVFEILRKTMDI